MTKPILSRRDKERRLLNLYEETNSFKTGRSFEDAEMGLIFTLNRGYRTEKSCVVEMGGVEPPSHDD